MSTFVDRADLAEVAYAAPEPSATGRDGIALVQGWVDAANSCDGRRVSRIGFVMPTQGLSDPIKVDSRLDDAMRVIDELAIIGNNWNGYGAQAPNSDSIGLARHLLTMLAEDAHIPDRIVPSANGGVSLYFFGPRRMVEGARSRYVCIECDNDGDIIFSTADREKEQFDAFEVNDRTADGIRKVMAKAGSFLMDC